MKKKLLAGVASVGILAGGGSGSALAVAAAPAAASTASVASSTSKSPGCGPLEPLVANGTITHAQAMAIRDAFVRYVRDHWRSTLDIVLGQEVRNMTITHAQATAVANAISQWVHKYQNQGKQHDAACHHGQDENMKGDSGDQ